MRVTTIVASKTETAMAVLALLVQEEAIEVTEWGCAVVLTQDSSGNEGHMFALKLVRYLVPHGAVVCVVTANKSYTVSAPDVSSLNQFKDALQNIAAQVA